MAAIVALALRFYNTVPPDVRVIIGLFVIALVFLTIERLISKRRNRQLMSAANARLESLVKETDVPVVETAITQSTVSTQKTPQPVPVEKPNVVWNADTRTRLNNDLKALTSEHASIKLLMANQKHRPLAESLVSIFNLAEWQATLINVPLDTYIHHTYFTGIEVLGHNKHLVDAVAECLSNAGLVGVKTIVIKPDIDLTSPGWNRGQHKIKITIGHQD